MARPKIVAIIGSTASGKTSMGVEIARWLDLPNIRKQCGIKGAEIISADSRQVYRHLDIGTGKTIQKEMKGIPHHGIDIADPKNIYTVEEYRTYAAPVIAKIYAEGKLPILVGGTGFYIDAILYGDAYPQVPPNWQLRKELESKTATELFEMLAKLDHERAANIDPNNKRRLVRAIEIIKQGAWIPPHNKKAHFDSLIIGITRDPIDLRSRIAKRIRSWMRKGLVQEVLDLHQQYNLSWERISDIGMDYRVVARYLQGNINKEEMLKKIETEIWRYAKRQLTYFKKMKDVKWIDNDRDAKKLVKEFLTSS